ncbi:MAG: hypothetical protein AB7R89_06135 [Dehalococcoidia bacterium]
MADPRKAVAFEGLGARFATYKIDNSTITYDKTEVRGTAQRDLAVTLSAAGTVELTADGDPIEGRLDRVEADGYAVVQVGGYTTLPGGDSASLTLGKKIVGDLGVGAAKGYIREVATGTAAELGLARGRVIDASTASATVVCLD